MTAPHTLRPLTGKPVGVGLAITNLIASPLLMIFTLWN